MRQHTKHPVADDIEIPWAAMANRKPYPNAKISNAPFHLSPSNIFCLSASDMRFHMPTATTVATSAAKTVQ
jgi:hypothetical protein